MYRYRPLRWTYPSSRGVLPSVCVCLCLCVCVCVSICVIRRNSNPLHPQCVGTCDANIKSVSYTFDLEILSLSKPRGHKVAAEEWLHPYVTSPLDASARLNSRAGCFTPPNSKMGGSHRRCGLLEKIKSLATGGIRTLDAPVLSQVTKLTALYRLQC